jgi:quercetin dioxygenase-like cupin family protein
MRTIENPRTGQRMRFLLTSAETGGELLRIETVNPPTGVPEPMHVHPHQETSAEVRSGRLRFVVDGVTRIVGPGERITIPPGVPHCFVNDGPDDAVAIQEARPALRTQEFFEQWFGLAARGELDDEGNPPLLLAAALGPVYADEIRLVRPPWPVQRVVYAVLGPLARRRRAAALR